MKQLTEQEIFIVSKYFDSIQDHINLIKTCKKYKKIRKQYNYNPTNSQDTYIFDIFPNIETFDKFTNIVYNDYVITNVYFLELYAAFKYTYLRDLPFNKHMIEYYGKNELFGYKLRFHIPSNYKDEVYIYMINEDESDAYSLIYNKNPIMVTEENKQLYFKIKEYSKSITNMQYKKFKTSDCEKMFKVTLTDGISYFTLNLVFDNSNLFQIFQKLGQIFKINRKIKYDGQFYEEDKIKIEKSKISDDFEDLEENEEFEYREPEENEIIVDVLDDFCKDFEGRLETNILRKILYSYLNDVECIITEDILPKYVDLLTFLDEISDDELVIMLAALLDI